jgi:ABC-2 type transport system ATP-binding protein
MSYSVKVSHLTKHFSVNTKSPGLAASLKAIISPDKKIVKAVDDISFSLNQGELVGFIGPNGAGKTTTLKCLSGLLHPSSGDISILGYTPFKRDYSFLRQIGFVMGQKNQLWWDIPPQETFLLHKAIYEIADNDYKRRLNFFYDTLDIAEVVSIPTKKLSLGQRMKCEFVAALLHSPRVIFLDEPTIGLDVVASQKIRKFIKQYNQEFKATIILTSHNMADVEQLCQRVILIDNGQIYYDGELDVLANQYRQTKTLKFTFEKPVKRQQISPYGSFHRHDAYKYTLSLPKNQALSVAGDILTHFAVVDLSISDTPIEEIISQIYTANHDTRQRNK